jgi:hypothetical protein
MAGGCADDCFLLPNAMCVNPGTTLANCEVSDQTPPPTNTPTETPTPGLACAGDCSGTLTVGAADLRTGIAFIFDPQFETSCPLAVFDWDDDGDVTAAEFLDAVRSAAFGCGAD